MLYNKRPIPKIMDYKDPISQSEWNGIKFEMLQSFVIRFGCIIFLNIMIDINLCIRLFL
jgi:hypothetical protein